MTTDKSSPLPNKGKQDREKRTRCWALGSLSFLSVLPSNSSSSKDPGVIPRAVDRLFQLVEERSDTLFVIRCSFVELHMDHFHDLLDPARHPSQRAKQLPSARQPAPLELHEDGRTGRVYLTGSPSLDTTVTSRNQALRLIEQGARLRTVAATQMNHISSRSHAVLTFYVESRLSDDSSAPVTMAKLHLVDLAGSERLARSQAEGATKKETQNINSSLSALGNISLKYYSSYSLGRQKKQ